MTPIELLIDLGFTHDELEDRWMMKRGNFYLEVQPNTTSIKDMIESILAEYDALLDATIAEYESDGNIV